MDGTLARLKASLVGTSALLALACTAGGTSAVGATVVSSDPHANLPAELVLTGTVRDFKSRQDDGGHPDFQRRPDGGFGVYAYMVADELDADGKPVMASSGRRVSTPWRDSEGRPIMPPRPHLPLRDGDSAGSAGGSDGGALTTGENFSEWYRDIPGVNASRLQDITLRRQSGSNVYVFDDREDERFAGLGGFFPINGELFGDFNGTGKNFHFTYELETQFEYEANSGQVFKFIGDDDVWVYVDGKCVIDLGGVHAAAEQTINLDRLDWLRDGQTYTLKFFFAERHTTQSNFRIETTLQLRTFSSEVAVSMPFD
ncbi:MAG: fibro-slime domain-containing protein [Planctomycetota bacterium]